VAANSTWRQCAPEAPSDHGLLAALACLRLRDQHPLTLPAVQVLLCANTDLTGTSPSMRENASGCGLDAEAIEFFNTQWVPDRSRWSDPAVSPLHAEDLAGLPPALVITAEHDPLRDEGEQYADRLRAAGVAVRARREPGLIHGFVMIDAVSPACAAALERTIGDIRELLGCDSRNQPEPGYDQGHVSQHPHPPQLRAGRD
jgi:acetyl esterase